MSEEIKNNPAGRLHDILEVVRHKDPNHSSRKVWADVFEVQESDTGLILKMLSDLIGLAGEAKEALQRFDDIEHSLYLAPFGRVDALFSQINLEGTWEPSRAKINEVTIYGLKIASDKLSRTSFYSKFEKKDLDELSTDLNDLLERIVSLALPEDLKMFFLRNLQALQYALKAYRIRGAEGLNEELERASALLLLHKEKIEQVTTGVIERDSFERYFKIIDRLNKFSTLTRNVKAIAGPVKTFALSASHTIPALIHSIGN